MKAPKRPPTMVVMFRPDFEAPITAGTKTHTIRPPRKRPIPPGAILSMRVWTGKPYRSKTREFARAKLDKIEWIKIHPDGVEISPGTLRVFWMGETPTKEPLLQAFARRDGFTAWATMRYWFEQTHGLPFEGQLIHWGPLII